jgi:hypothetical protein
VGSELRGKYLKKQIKYMRLGFETSRSAISRQSPAGSTAIEIADG